MVWLGIVKFNVPIESQHCIGHLGELNLTLADLYVFYMYVIFAAL